LICRTIPLIYLSSSLQQNRELHDCFKCHVAKVDVIREEGDPSTEIKEEPGLSCVTQNRERGYRATYDISLPGSFTATYKNEIQAGIAHICIPGGYISKDNTVVIPDPATVQYFDVDLQDRRLDSSVRLGPKKLLAVRVKTNHGEVPDESAKDIEAAIFGTGDSTRRASAVSQYKAVSHGSLQYEAATGKGINNGVAEVEVTFPVAGKGILTFINQIVEATVATVGPLDQVADHTIFCIPNGSLLQGSSGWKAFANTNENYSFYQYSRCTSLSAVMHEMGHAIGFRHSGQGNMEYGTS